MTTKRYWHVGVRLLAGVGVACAVVVLPAWPVGLARTQVGARLTTAHPWVGKGQWIRADTHTHTRFSDGNRTVDDVAAQAEKYGCDAVAITDHSSRERGAATPEYAAAIRAARLAHPRLMIVAGVEWNVPPYNSRGACLRRRSRRVRRRKRLSLSSSEDLMTSIQLDGTKPRAEDALAWLAQLKGLGAPPVAVYNHPSRKDETSLENVEDMTRWRSGNDIMIGFEGGPGHQGTNRSDRTTRRSRRSIDGIPLWQSLGTGGIPCCNEALIFTRLPRLRTFTPTIRRTSMISGHVSSWRRGTTRLNAVRSGCCAPACRHVLWCSGHIAREVEFTATANGLARPAAAGERISAPAGTVINFSVRATVPEVDWRGAPNRLDAIEFITVKPGGVTEQSYPADGSGVRTATHRVTIGTEDVVVRARGRRVVSDGPDLMFYTNAIRVAVRR